jgi:ABC-2 type transport system ATP-binding protein
MVGAPIQVLNLTKYYGALPAVRGVTFTVERGQILGLLGPNGSGKSTTVSMLTGMREPSAGRILWEGEPIENRIVDYKARLGYVPEEAQLYTFLSGREHLQLVGRLRRLPATALAHRIDALLRLFGLDTVGDQAISAYSKGMRQKIVIIAALLHDPDLLVLDEPESGLDFSASLVLRHLIELLAARGKTVVYSSHVLDYIERLCERVLVLHRGLVVAEGPVTELRARITKDVSLETVVAELVVAVDPRQTAQEIADVVEGLT